MTIQFTESVLLALEQQRQSASGLAKRERYLALLSPLPNEHILDLGCGGGGFCRALAPLVVPGGRVLGVDRSPAAAELAGRLSAETALDLLGFEQADGHDLPFADGSFDATSCISVLAFCEEPGLVLAELRRVLRSGGRLLVANSDEDTRIYNGHDRDLGRRLMRAIASRTRDPWLGRRLAYLLSSAGFKLVEEEVFAEIERHFVPGTAGYTMAYALREYALGGGVSTQDYERWLADLESCEQDGSYCYSVTTFAYLAER